MKDILFLPVKPKWASKIISGEKILELRKALPSKGYGKRCVIYASSPQCEIIGTCTLSLGLAFGIEDIRPLRLRHACVTRAEFDAYFAGSACWFGLDLADPTPFTNPISLHHMQQKWGLNPPQQWCFIDEQMFDEIVWHGALP